VQDRRALQRAWDLLAFLLGERAEPPGDFDPALIARVAASHRLDAVLAEPGFAAVDPQVHLPPSVWDAWRTARAAALGESAMRMSLLRRTLEDLRPFPVTLFKGFPAAELIYPSPGSRAMGDVDLLVHAADLRPIIARLQELGFAQVAGGTAFDRPCFFEWAFEKPGLSLDLHRGWTYPARLPIDYQEVLGRCAPWTAFAENARLLAPEDAFLCQALQGPLTDFSPNAFPWIGMLDLREMLRPGAFWPDVSELRLDRDVVWRRAGEWGVRPMLAATLRLGGTLFAPLRDLATRARPAFTSAEMARATLATLGALPPRLNQTALWIRMARRAILTQTRFLPSVALQGAQRGLCSTDR
jgi:Uncharacterised nucleotidyltransferase